MAVQIRLALDIEDTSTHSTDDRNDAVSFKNLGSREWRPFVLDGSLGNP
jgi:hypothetical protein